MIDFNHFYQIDSDQRWVISAAQGSTFAKRYANDFNPLHDADNRRFVVPGDLLFALVLHQFGLRSQMAFSFSAAVAADSPLQVSSLERDSELTVELYDSRDKVAMTARAAGPGSDDSALINQLVAAYVSFSGQNFPGILMPLLQQQQVMINPDRPLVMYEGMDFALDSFALSAPQLQLHEATLSVDGRRGQVVFNFVITEQGEVVGRGKKYIALGGLRPYQAAPMDAIVADYLARRQAYQA